MKSGPRLALALPFTVIAEPGAMRLIAGEDARFTFRRAAIERFGVALIERLRTSCTREEAIAAVAEDDRAAAIALLDRLLGERVVVDAGPAPAPASFTIEVRGARPLAEHVREACASSSGPRLVVLCQDTLDYGAALAFQREVRAEAAAWMWITEAPLARAFVSPLFRDDGGPCLGCLLSAFRRLSPTPELYDALAAHVDRGGALTPAGFDDGARRILASIAALKIAGASLADPEAAAFGLHVLERARLEVTLHPLAVDVDCAEHDR